MEPITTAIAISALWSLLESALKIVAEEAVKETSKPFNIKISNWFQKFTKAEEKNRYQTFLDAYYNAEQRFIQKHGIAPAYRTFRQMPKAVDDYRRNPRYVIDSLVHRVPTDESETRIESDKVSEFMSFVKRELWGTDLYRPIIEYYNEEEAQDLRKKSVASLSTLAKTVDVSLDAIRVVIAEPPKDFRNEREKYLKRIETTFLEHQLSGLPIYREVKNPLLSNLFVVLDIGYENGGEALNEEIEKIFGNEGHVVSNVESSNTESSPSWLSADDSFDNTIFDKNLWLIVLGEPGSGKSTTLKKMSLDYAENAQLGEINYSGIPIYLPLREYAKERKKSGVGYGILDFIYDYSKGSLNIPCSDGFFEYYLEEGDNLVCFDGLDEVTSIGQRQEITDVVESFVQLFPKNRIVVTSRVSGYEQAPLTRRLFPHYAVKPLSDQKILSFIKQWYKLREKTLDNAEKQAEELHDAIMKQDRILKLARNPLLLTIISLIHKVEATLPNDRVKLYEKCSEALLNTFEGAKQIENRDEEKVYFRFKEDLLEAVAYWMQKEIKGDGGREISIGEEELIAFLTELLSNDPDFELPKREARQQAESFISLIQERTGILVERGKGQYAFVHLTFQEYFAASYICKTFLHDTDQLLNTIIPTLFDPSWTEVNLLLFGKLGHLTKKVPSVLADKILRANSEDILHRALQFFTSALVDNIKFDKSIQDSLVQNWIKILKSPICETELRFAIDALRTLRHAVNLDDFLISLAKDTNQSAKFRLNSTKVYLDIGKPSDWTFDNLRSIVFEPNVDELTLANSIELILKNEFPLEIKGQLLLDIQKSDLWRKQILALVFNHEFMRNNRSFSEDIVSLKEYLSMNIVDETPEFSLVFARFGIDGMWDKLFSSLNTQNGSDELLNNLLCKVKSLFWAESYNSDVIGLPYWHHIDVPLEIKDKFTDYLLGISNYLTDAPMKISVIKWLEHLSAPPRRMFDMALTIEDDFNLDFQGLFGQYIKELGVDKEISQYPDSLLRISERIFTAPNKYVKKSYFEALVAHSNDSLLEKTFIEWLNRDDLSIATKYIISSSFSHELIKNDKVLRIFRSWLGDTDSWEQAFIAHVLLELNIVGKSEVLVILNQLEKMNNPYMVKELIVILRKFGAEEEAMRFSKNRIALRQTMLIDDRMIRGAIYNAIFQPVTKYSSERRL